MIDVYSWATPNGHKVHIMLEETGLLYRVHAVNIRAGDQFNPDFLKISPNNRIPAIVDQDGPGGKPFSVFESGAILLYLAEKAGKFIPAGVCERHVTLQWLMWQMGGVGPMFGQANHFRGYALDKIEYAIERYTKEANRLTGVLNRRLGEARYLSGDEYSIADIAVFPWIRIGSNRKVIDLTQYQHAKRWFDEVNGRAAVQRGVQVLAAEHIDTAHTEKSRDVLFGNTQYARR